ncbi:presqualene diphosphate synthase HpnD [Pigmentiphaga soli]|uniref:Presqualene diphosphate synthase HpnD n=1 Tax=Pigmentiphaga soli TaxID=1007095 RepID=A0ABP8GW74_9BURK
MGVVQTMEAHPAEAAAAPAAVASGSSFYKAMRILPRDQRDAMFEIYSFCRQVDDIADGDGPRQARLQALEQWRRDIDRLYAPAQPPARLAGLASAVARYGLERHDFLAVIDGMQMDVEAAIVAPDADTLDLYCDRVASAVGRLAVKVFGMPRDAGLALSHHLGRALQLTNILRDIDEDAGLGRVYLPRELLRAAGVERPGPEAVRAAALDAACLALAAQARRHFDAARAIIAQSPRRTVLAPAVMADAYGLVLARLVRRGFAPPRAPVRLSRLQKAGLALLLLRHRLFR